MLYLYTYLNVWMNSLRKEEGQGMAEYGLILVVVALIAVAGFALLGEELENLMDTIVGELNGTGG